MKKDYVISRIEASQDGATHVYIALSDPNDFKPGARKAAKSVRSKHDGVYLYPGRSNEKFAISNSNMGGGGLLTDSSTFKISMREYEDMAIKVGDKITKEINKSDSRSGR